MAENGEHTLGYGCGFSQCAVTCLLSIDDCGYRFSDLSNRMVN